MSLCAVSLEMAPQAVFQERSVVHIQPLECNWRSNGGHGFQRKFVFAMLETIDGHYHIKKMSHNRTGLLVELE